jgi:6-phosphogluconolactonase
MRTEILVGSYAPAHEPGISVFSFDESAHTLQLGVAFAGVRNPSFLAVDPARRHLYAVSETGLGSDGTCGAVHAFRIERERGSFDLVPLNHRSTGGDHPCHLAIDATGRWIVASNYGSGDVAVFPIEPDGSLGEIVALVRHAGSGPRADRQGGPHAHSAIFPADNRFLLVADLGIDRIVTYAFDPTDGSVDRHGELAASPGAGPRHMAFHPDGSHVMVVNELDSSVTLYRYDATSGALNAPQTLSTLPDGVTESTAADIRLAPSGSYAYVSNRGHDSVAVFAFDPQHGLLRTAVRPCGGEWPRGLGVAPEGGHLIAANRHSNEIVVLPLRAAGSDIGEPVARAGVAQPSCVVFV